MLTLENESTPARTKAAKALDAPSLAARPNVSPWLLIRGALLPDYNAAAIAYWIALLAAGLGVLVAAARHVGSLPSAQAGEVALIAVIASLVALVPLRLPKSKNSIAAGDVFIFLLLVLHGPLPAALAAAAESAVCAWRTSKRWSSRLASPAAAGVAMALCGHVYQSSLALLTHLGMEEASAMFGALMLFALLYFVVSPTLVTAVIFLKQRRVPTAPQWLEAFGWVGLGYAGSASVAAVVYLAFRQFGLATMLYAAPMVGMFLTTLHYYFARQEAEAREVAERASLERAEAAERAAAQAALHLRELEASDRRFHSAFTHAAVGMSLATPDGTVLQVNGAMCALISLSAQDAAGRKFRNLLNPLDAPVFEQELERMRRAEIDGFQLELRLRHANGRELWVSLHCGRFDDADAGTACLIFQAFDVTARRLAEARMQHMAYHDGLTNLANRSRLYEALAQAIEAQHQDPGRTFAVLCLSLDRLKLLKDSFGLGAGDQLLVLAARRVKEQVGLNDVVARLSSDEFAILLHCHGRPVSTVTALAERLVATFAEPFIVEGTEVATGISVGITLSEVGYLTPDEALRDADLARQRAGANGQSQHVIFDPTLHARAKERLLLEAELRRAIAASQISLAFQPIFEIDTGTVAGFEALARWDHPERGAVSPAQFIPVAEDSGLIGSLTRYMIRRACQRLRGWIDSFPQLAHLYVNVNISGFDLCDAKFADYVGDTLRELKLPPRALTLEITENTLMQQLDLGSATLVRLHELGVGLSVDDFGTGYSSLSYLSALPVNSLKIDRSFVNKLDSRAHDAEIVRAVVQLGDATGRQVIAEGIETREQLDHLRAIGCEFGQGFFFSRPLDAHKVLALLESLALGRVEPPLSAPATPSGVQVDQV